MERVTLGRIARPHGIRGEVRVHLYNPGSELLAGQDEVFLGDTPRRVESSRPGPGGAWLLRLEGIADRDAAEALRGVEVAVPREALPEVEEDVYLADLVGLKVVDEAGHDLGTVEGVEQAGPQDLLVIRRDRGRWLLPAVEALIVEVDRAAGVLHVAPPEGLVDLEEA